MPISKVAEENEVLRLDSLYFQRRDIDQLKQIYAQAHDRLGDICYVTDGIHASIDFDEGSGIKLISAKHPKEGYFDLTSVEEISAASHAVNPRTALNLDDVLISTVGTIGNAAVVRDEMLPANSDRHVGIIRPRNDVERPLSSDYLTAFLISRYGRIQSSRETTGNVQPNLFLIKIRDFKVARFSDRFEALVEALSLRTLAAFRSSTDKQKQAEDTLLAALGLADWEPPEPLSYTARASDAFAAGRLDAEFFQPRLKSLINKLEEAAGDFRLVALGAYSEPLKYGSSEKLEYADKGTPFLRITDLNERRFDLSSVKFIDNKLAFSEAETAKLGDILVSRSGTLGLAAPITEEFDAAIFGSYFIRVRPDNSVFNTEFLALFINSIAGVVQFEAVKTGGIQTNLTISAIENLMIPLGTLEWQATFVTLASEGLVARDRAHQTLKAAKRAVEIAIENGEAAALGFLDQSEGAI